MNCCFEHFYGATSCTSGFIYSLSDFGMKFSVKTLTPILGFNSIQFLFSWFKEKRANIFECSKKSNTVKIKLKKATYF
jgi:hypothetical protein